MKPIVISPYVADLAPSLTVAVDVKIQEKVAQGADIVNLGVGQPDFPTPGFISEAAAKAVREGATRYTPPGGTPLLRKAAAEYFTRLADVPAEASNTMVSCGAKHCLHEALVAVLHPGDELLLPVPYWVTYPEQAKLARAVPVPVQPASGLKVSVDDLERHRTPKSRALILNSPNNPTGLVYDAGEVEAIAEWCLKHEVILISDEIYDRLVYGGRTTISPASLGAEMAARTITINGVSKAFAMTGWRIGFLTGPEEVVKGILKFQGQTTGNPAAVSQAAALAAVQSDDAVVETMRVAYERRRDLVLESLAGVPGLELIQPEGAFYAFPKVEASERAGGSIALAEKLVGHGVGVVPGLGFGAEGHLRLSFAVGDEALAKGLDRLKEGLKSVV